ncbi:MAG TPA: exodeoxyribonuclease III [Myxococcota bacterium]|nr:exodeoxyribonuclease III [Myxococcota bacterium]
MRIATFNVNGLRARQDFLLHWLRARRPDVVALQELKLEDAHFPSEALEKEGYRAVCQGQKSWNGVAILAREEPVVVRRGIEGQEALGARLLTADVAGIRFTSVYVPNGKSVVHPDFELKLAWLAALPGALGADTDRPSVVAGDFNVCPGPLDSWNEEGLRGRIFHTDIERARVRALVDAGWRDLFRERHPEKRAFSWWDYRAGSFHKGQGLRIDLILGTSPVLARVREVEIDRDYRKKKDGLAASDHAPVWADLE